jgi:hypothetical protein
VNWSPGRDEPGRRLRPRLTEGALNELKRRRAEAVGGQVRRYASHTSPVPRQSGVYKVLGGWTPVSNVKVYSVFEKDEGSTKTNLLCIVRSGSDTFGAPMGLIPVLQPWYSRENLGPGADRED